MKENIIEIDIGDEGIDYQVPNFLRAIDNLFKTFDHRNGDVIPLIDAMEMYAKHMRIEFE